MVLQTSSHDRLMQGMGTWSPRVLIVAARNSYAGALSRLHSLSDMTWPDGMLTILHHLHERDMAPMPPLHIQTQVLKAKSLAPSMMHNKLCRISISRLSDSGFVSKLLVQHVNWQLTWLVSSEQE